MNKKYFFVFLGLLSGVVTAYVNTLPIYEPLFYAAGPIFGVFLAIGLQKNLIKSSQLIAISTIAYYIAVEICLRHFVDSQEQTDILPEVQIWIDLLLAGAVGSLILTLGIFLVERFFSWKILLVMAVFGSGLSLPFYIAFLSSRLNQFSTYLVLFVSWQVGIAFLIAHFFGDTRKIAKSARKSSS